MKILITGGCGFIGSHVADRLFQEGNEIHIIDNLSSGNARNVSTPYKFYNYDVADLKCEEVFKSNKFNVVIHLAAQASVITSINCPYLDVKTNILGTVNMLNLSSRYGVKKFIFASSAAVYGNSDIIPIDESCTAIPLSPYGMSKHTGELYCRKWAEIYGLNTLCLRFSNIYGPKQGSTGEGGVISIFIERTLKEQPLIVYGDGNQTRDFLYVEDLADAVSKSIQKGCGGVMNLSTNSENTLNRLVQILEKLHSIKGVIHENARDGDIYRSRLDNARIKEVLEWNPLNSFEDGIKKTFEWSKNNKK